MCLLGPSLHMEFDPKPHCSMFAHACVYAGMTDNTEGAPFLLEADQGDSMSGGNSSPRQSGGPNLIAK